MNTPGRREFLKRAAVAATTAVAANTPLNADALAAGAEAIAPARPASATVFDQPLLNALATAVLPEALGAAGHAMVVRGFSAWIAGYRPVSEEMHGYGNQEITYTASDPAPGWNAQLQGLDLLARRTRGKSFVALDTLGRRALLGAQLARANGRLPANPIAATHVAIALLAFWAGSSAATDLAYGVRILKDNCRVLADTVRRPLPNAAQPAQPARPAH